MIVMYCHFHLPFLCCYIHYGLHWYVSKIRPENHWMLSKFSPRIFICRPADVMNVSLVTQVAPWGAWTVKSHGHSPRAVRWLTAQQFNIRNRIPERTVHVPHPLYNPVAQGNWPHSLARRRYRRLRILQVPWWVQDSPGFKLRKVSRAECKFRNSFILSWTIFVE